MQAKGTLGLIATNTVAQGDSREVGLDAMVAAGFTITRAIQSRSWPAASANLEYAAVWGTLDEIPADVPRIADDIEMRLISTLLEPSGRAEGNPLRLAENSGIGFQGCIVLGMGFVVERGEAEEWIAADARNADVLFPYLNGEDLNSRPDASASRWVIDFREMAEAEAASYSAPWSRVEAAVRPERITKDAAKYPRMVHEWWKFWNARPVMRSAIADLSEVLVIARVSKTVMPLRVRTGQVPSEACVVFATDDYGDQAVLSSSLHQIWAITYGSGMRNDPRYTPSDVFETFPRPSTSQALEEIGRALDEERREVMLRRDLGLTRLYNLVNDPGFPSSSDDDISRIRSIHVELDRVVLDAYGWSDLELDHGYYSHRRMERWTVNPSARVEIMDRLLDENHRRAAIAVATGRARQDVLQQQEGTLFA